MRVSELAAALAYRVLFSLVPFIALLAAILDAILPSDTRADVVGWLLGALPGTTVQTGVQQELAKAGAITSLAGMIAFGALMWTASGMTRSLRIALAVIWDAEPQLAFVRAKLRDIAALGVLAGCLVAVFALSVITQVAVQAGADLSTALGFDGAAAIVARVAEIALTATATFAALLLLYRMATPVEVPLRTSCGPAPSQPRWRSTRGSRATPSTSSRSPASTRSTAPARRGARVPGAAVHGVRAGAVRSGTGRRPRRPEPSHSHPKRMMRRRACANRMRP